MVGTKVTRLTRSYRPEETGWIWTSDGVNSYDIEARAGSLPAARRIVINVKEADREFSRSHRVESIIQRYSNFVGFPSS